MKLFRAALVLALLASTSAAALGEGGTLSPPRLSALDLSRVHLRGDRAFASLGNGVEAELTLDPELDRAALALLKDADPLAGAAVMIDARSGEVLALAERGKGGASTGLLTQARAPAASVFKLVTTAALFETTEVSPGDEVCIAGGERGVERRHLQPPRSGDIQCAPFFQALGHSRNAAYAQLVTKHLLRSDLIAIASKLGFNSEVPFDLTTSVGKLRVPYNDLEFARTATGFENSTLSLMGGAYLASIIASGGMAPRFRIVKHAGDYQAPSGIEYVGRVLSPETARRLRAMMELTTRSGTARHAFSDDEGRRYLGSMRIAGKTGTLQPSAGAPTSSWFVGFAPAENPRVVITVLLQNGNVWRRKAAEVARDLLRVYFHERKSPGISAPEAVAER